MMKHILIILEFILSWSLIICLAGMLIAFFINSAYTLGFMFIGVSAINGTILWLVRKFGNY